MGARDPWRVPTGHQNPTPLVPATVRSDTLIGGYMRVRWSLTCVVAYGAYGFTIVGLDDDCPATDYMEAFTNLAPIGPHYWGRFDPTVIVPESS